MTKKLLAISLVLLMMVPAVFAKSDGKKLVPTDNKTQILVPGTARQIPANLLEVRTNPNQDDLEFIRIKPSANIKGVDQRNQAASDQLWPLKHVDDNAEYYLGSGAANDTFAVVFRPAAPAIVQHVYQQWFTPGNANAFGADYSAEALALSPDGIADDDDAPVSPIGKLRTTITPNTIEAYDDSWSTELDIGGTFIVGDSTDLGNVPHFVIAFVKGGDTPQPLADATSDQGGISYTWFGGPWTDGEWGDYNPAVDVMMLVQVTYPWGAPISIQSLSQVNNTFDTAGPFTVVVDVLDDVKDGAAINANDTLTYHYTVNGEGEMTGDLAASDIGADGNGLYTFDIAGTFAPGDVIEYWVTTVDNDNLPSESVHLMFEIKEPSNPGADLLIIYDSENDSQLENMFYEHVAADLGIVYEYWNTVDEQGIDASVINAGWSNIVVYGWGTGIVPAVAGEYDPGFADFLDAGGNLLLADQDWYYGHGLPAEITFAAGDFAYDYFGIGSGSNDPSDDNGDSNADTAFYGVGGTPMDLPFAAAPMVIDHNLYGTTNWGDPVIPATATGIFSGANDGLSYGVAYDQGTYKTAYFGFMPDAAVDTAAGAPDDLMSDQFDEFFTGALQWMGVSSPPLVSGVTGYMSSADGAARTVEATIVDFDGEAITANLVHSVDGGVTWNETAMTATGDVFSADLPALTTEDWVVYYVEATDASGAVTTEPNANQAALAFYFFVPTTDVLYVDATMGYYGYFAGHHAAAFGTMDMYDLYEYGDQDGSVFSASHYSTIIWNAEYELGYFWPLTAGHELADFVAAGGNVVLTGDEALAWGYGWPGPIWFEAGEAMYDVFGLTGAWSDAWDFAPLEPVAGTLTEGLTLTYAPPYGLTDWMDQGNVGDFSIYQGSGSGGGTGTVDTLEIIQSAWYGTAYNSGSHKAVFLPLYMGGFSATDGAALGSAVLAYFDDAAAPAGIQGIIGPESGNVFDVTVDRDDVQLVTEFALNDAYPNPFNPTTNISFEVPHTSDVVVSVYNMLGQKVVELANATYNQGIYNVTWNGLDANGNAVGSGLYIYHMDAGEFSATNKMLYLK